jgi:hypothetical protein
MTSTVRIPWIQGTQNIKQWDEVHNWAIEYFGPPGRRFHSRASVFHMDFVFKSSKDALMMSLMWNAKVVTEEDLTVEFVGSMFNG